MKTDRDMRAAIIRALDEGTPDGHTAYDVQLIQDACHAVLADSVDPWNLDHLSSQEFWELVKAIDARNLGSVESPTPADLTVEGLLNAMIAND